MSNGLLIGMIIGLFIIVVLWIIALVIIIPKWRRYEKKIKCTSQVEGTIVKLRNSGIDSPTVIYVDYEVDDVTYQLKESMKLRSSAIKAEKVPIGQRKTSVLGDISVGATVNVYYDEENPKFAYIAGNEGVITS